MSEIPKTTNGFPVYNVDCQRASQQDADNLIEAMLEHGVVCIKNQDLDAKQLRNFIRKVSTSGENFIIPNLGALSPAFDNPTDADGIVKISNIDKNGKIIENCKAAEYWHSDGQFWYGKMNQLWNFMHMKTIPKVGGGTAFLDGVVAMKILKRDYPDLAETLKKIVTTTSQAAVGDFNSKVATDTFSKGPSEHEVFSIHAKSGKEVLYFGAPKSAKFKVKDQHRNDEEFKHLSDQELDIKMEEIKAKCFSIIDTPDCYYAHNWGPNEVIVWDNTMGMHQSMGGYGNYPRYAIRGQTLMWQD